MIMRWGERTYDVEVMQQLAGVLPGLPAPLVDKFRRTNPDRNAGNCGFWVAFKGTKRRILTTSSQGESVDLRG